METPIHMFVKCALNLQLQQFFFHAVIFVVSHFLFEYFHFLIFQQISFGFTFFFWIWITKLNIEVLFAVCKSCSLACSECPICRTNIADRLFAFTSWAFLTKVFCNIFIIFLFDESCSSAILIQHYNVFSFSAFEFFAVLYFTECSKGCNSFISLLVCKHLKGKLITYSFFHWKLYIIRGDKRVEKKCKKERV